MSEEQNIQPSDAASSSAAKREAEQPDEQTVNEQAPDAQTPNAQTSDEQTPDAQASDEQAPDAQAPDEQTSDAQAPDAQTSDAVTEKPDLVYDGIVASESAKPEESGDAPSEGEPAAEADGSDAAVPPRDPESDARRDEVMTALGESAVSILTEAFRPQTAPDTAAASDADKAASDAATDEKTPLSEITDEYFGGIAEKVIGDLERGGAAPEPQPAPKPEEKPSAAIRPPKRASKNSDKIILIPVAVFCTFIVVVLLVNLLDSVTQLGAKTVYSVQSVSRGVDNAVFEAYRRPITITLTSPDESVTSMSVEPYTVGELIDELYGSVSGEFIANLPSDTVLTDGMDITIWEVKNGTYEVVESMTYTTEIVEVQTIPKGTDVVVQSGSDGVARRTYADTYLNGELSESVVLSETVIVEPVTEVVYRGVGGTFTAKNGRSYSYSYYIDVEATAYGVDTGYGGDGTHTATGALAQSGVIAVDPEVIPLGSKLFVTGDYKEIGVCRAEDTGGAILGSRIDIYMGSDLEAQVAFGRRDMRVYVLD